LTSLNLTACGHVTEAGISALIVQFPGLSKLTLTEGMYANMAEQLMAEPKPVSASPSGTTSGVAEETQATSQEYLSFLALQEAMEQLVQARGGAGSSESDQGARSEQVRRGYLESAEQCLEKSLQFFPGNKIASFKLAALRCGAMTEHKMCPAAYTRDLFDQYADTFEESLTRLQYSVPQRIAELLGRQRTGCADGGASGALWSSKLLNMSTETPLEVIDCGCGTGWVGDCLRPIFGSAMRLHGVDLSPKMVSIAQAKSREGVQTYTEVHCAECMAHLQLKADGGVFFDVVVAADVAPYIGDLRPFLTRVKRCLQKDGLLIFTVESLEHAEHLPHSGLGLRQPSSVAPRHQESATETGPVPVARDATYRLLETERYAHALPYLRGLLLQSGFLEVHFEARSFRQNRGTPLPGYLLVAKHSLLPGGAE
jgi:predicted TPR repeat methyltransferase